MNEPNEARGNAHFLTSVHSLSWKVPWQQPGLPTPCDLLCVTSPNPTENRYFYLQTCKCQSVKSFWSLEKMTQTSIKRRFCSSASYITDLKPTDGHFTVYYLKVWCEHLKKNITTVLFKWLHSHSFSLFTYWCIITKKQRVVWASKEPNYPEWRDPDDAGKMLRGCDLPLLFRFLFPSPERVEDRGLTKRTNLFSS